MPEPGPCAEALDGADEDLREAATAARTMLALGGERARQRGAELVECVTACIVLHRRALSSARSEVKRREALLARAVTLLTASCDSHALQSGSDGLAPVRALLADIAALDSKEVSRAGA